MYSVEYHKRVIKFLAKKDLKFRTQVLDTFDDIAKNPYTSNYDIKSLKNTQDNRYRLRLGKYRFIYKIMDEEILIFVDDADSKGGIYKA